MNNYLIETNDSFTFQQERDELIKEKGFRDATINSYDLGEESLKNVLEDLDTYGLFSEKKVIIVSGLDSFKIDDQEEDYHHLQEYLKHPSEDNLVLFRTEKIDSSKIYKDLKKDVEVISATFDFSNYLKTAFKDYKVSPGTLQLLEEVCQGDASKLVNECNKLKEYCFEKKEVTDEDVSELVVKKLGDSSDLLFHLSRSITERDRKSALKDYQELLSYQIEPYAILGLIASQFRFIYQVKILEDRGLRDSEIAQALKVKSDYRIKKTRELTRLYSENSLLNIMKQLGDMDLKMKSEGIDPNNILEMFILNI